MPKRYSLMKVEEDDVEGKTVTINNDKRTYDGHPDTGVVYVVNYVYHNDYDAEFVQGT